MHYKKGEAVTQGSLFPVSLDELIPADHSVRVIAAYVEHLSLASNTLTSQSNTAIQAARGKVDEARDFAGQREVVCAF